VISGSQRVKTTRGGVWSTGALFVICFLCSFAFTEEKAPGRLKEKLPQSVAPQPVAFSHQVHAGKVGPCNFCHVGAAEGDEATVPSVDFCLTCHRTIKADSPEVAKLKAASEKGKDIAWVPVYRVPDFVFFGHAPHIKAGLHCAECHGPVETRDVLQKEVSTSMNSCRECHRRRGAPMECVACHQLGH
jgi:Class III cytochrome C family/Cytochrome c7 and related cytochrome c